MRSHFNSSKSVVALLLKRQFRFKKFGVMQTVLDGKYYQSYNNKIMNY